MTTQSRPTRRPATAEAEAEGEWLPLQVAALRLNLSVDAVRRRLKSGGLRGRRVRGQRGLRWEVLVGADTPVEPDDDADSAAPEDTFVRDESRGVDSGKWAELMRELLSENAELGRQIGRLNDERAELFGRCGYLQGQLAAAQEQIRALQAPEPEAAPPRRRWWRFFGN